MRLGLFKIPMQFMHLDPVPDPATQINADPRSETLVEMEEMHWKKGKEEKERRKEGDVSENATETEEKGTGE